LRQLPSCYWIEQSSNQKKHWSQEHFTAVYTRLNQDPVIARMERDANAMLKSIEKPEKILKLKSKNNG
jgi:hypothetical protein